MTATTTSTASAQLAELEERVRAGDANVTAAALAKARAAVDLELLADEAAARMAEQQAADHLEDARELFRTETLAEVGAELAQLQGLYEAVVAAGTALHAAMPEFAARARAAERQAERLGLPDCDIRTSTFEQAWRHASREASGALPKLGGIGRPPRMIRHPLHSAQYADRIDASLRERWENGRAGKQAARWAEQQEQNQRRQEARAQLVAEVARARSLDPRQVEHFTVAAGDLRRPSREALLELADEVKREWA